MWASPKRTMTTRDRTREATARPWCLGLRQQSERAALSRTRRPCSTSCPWRSPAFADAVARPPIVQPESTKVSSAASFAKTHTSWNFFAPMPRPAWTSAIFMYVVALVRLLTARPLPEPPPATKIFMPKLRNTAWPAAGVGRGSRASTTRDGYLPAQFSRTGPTSRSETAHTACAIDGCARQIPPLLADSARSVAPQAHSLIKRAGDASSLSRLRELSSVFAASGTRRRRTISLRRRKPRKPLTVE